MKPYEITVDVKNLNTFQDNSVYAKQRDIGRKVRATITDNGLPIDLTGRSVVFYSEKRDKNIIFNSTQIIDKEKGLVEFELTSQVLALTGTLESELLISSVNQEKITTALFNVYIKKSINKAEAIESTNEFTALDNAITLINIYRDEMNNLEANYAPELQGLLAQFNDVVANATIDSEVIAARTSTVTGKTYDSVNLRLNDTEEKNIIESNGKRYITKFEVVDNQPRIRLEEV